MTEQKKKEMLDRLVSFVILFRLDNFDFTYNQRVLYLVCEDCECFDVVPYRFQEQHRRNHQNMFDEHAHGRQYNAGTTIFGLINDAM